MQRVDSERTMVEAKDSSIQMQDDGLDQAGSSELDK